MLSFGNTWYVGGSKCKIDQLSQQRFQNFKNTTKLLFEAF